MLKFVQQNQSILALLTGGLAGAVLTAVVTWARREKKKLAYSVTSQNMAYQDGDRRLTFAFGGQPVLRLDGHVIVVRNVGNRALKNIPVTVQLHQSARILETVVEAPKGLTLSCRNQNPVSVSSLVT